MDEKVKAALEQDRTVDITTIGRNTGVPIRIEIRFHKVDNRIYLTGTPGPRDWYANLLRTPDFTFHLKGRVQVDLAATAVPIRDETRRRRILGMILQRMRGLGHLEAWVAGSPLVEVIWKGE